MSRRPWQRSSLVVAGSFLVPLVLWAFWSCSAPARPGFAEAWTARSPARQARAYEHWLARQVYEPQGNAELGLLEMVAAWDSLELTLTQASGTGADGVDSTLRPGLEAFLVASSRGRERLERNVVPEFSLVLPPVRYPGPGVRRLYMALAWGGDTPGASLSATDLEIDEGHLLKIIGMAQVAESLAELVLSYDETRFHPALLALAAGSLDPSALSREGSLDIDIRSAYRSSRSLDWLNRGLEILSDHRVATTYTTRHATTLARARLLLANQVLLPLGLEDDALGFSQGLSVQAWFDKPEPVRLAPGGIETYLEAWHESGPLLEVEAQDGLARFFSELLVRWLSPLEKDS